MDCRGILAIYEKVAGISGQILAAARDGDWEKSAELEADCARQIEILKREDDGGGICPSPSSSSLAWTDEALQEKARLIQEILSIHAEIRQLTTPRLAELLDLIGSAHTEHKLLQAYGIDCGKPVS